MDDTEKKKRFLYKLIPPRPTFVQDMTEFEKKYARTCYLLERSDRWWHSNRLWASTWSTGPWGVGIVDLANESDVRAVGTNDPAVKAGGLKFEVYLMPGVVVWKNGYNPRMVWQ
jgi:hypothetical protein